MGIHNHNGFQEILSTWPDAEGGYYCNDVLACVNGSQRKNIRVLHLKVPRCGVLQIYLVRNNNQDTLFFGGPLELELEFFGILIHVCFLTILKHV